MNLDQGGFKNPNWKGNRKTICYCRECGVAFEDWKYRIAKGRGQFCSRICTSKFTVRKTGYQSGNKNPSWKGGHYKRKANKIRNSHDNITWKRMVLELDESRCKFCGKKEHLEIHHLFGFTEYDKIRFDIRNGVALCKGCHHEIHKGKREL
jgi:hypothetical protein